MTRYLLDTDTASAGIRGDPRLDARLAPGTLWWAVSAVTRAELRFGIALRPHALNLARRVEGFLAAAVTLPWDEAAADAHGRLRALLRQRGTPIGVYDEMIAAHALAVGATVVTNNVRHFSAVPGLHIENWLAAQP